MIRPSTNEKCGITGTPEAGWGGLGVYGRWQALFYNGLRGIKAWKFSNGQSQIITSPQVKYFVQVWALSFQMNAKYPHVVAKDQNAEEQMTDEAKSK